MFTCNSCKSCGSRRQRRFPKFVCLFILFIGVFISLVGSEHLLCAGQHSRQWTYSSDGDRPTPHRAQRVVEETDNKQVSKMNESLQRECEVLQEEIKPGKRVKHGVVRRGPPPPSPRTRAGCQS